MECVASSISRWLGANAESIAVAAAIDISTLRSIAVAAAVDFGTLKSIAVALKSTEDAPWNRRRLLAYFWMILDGF